MLNIDLQIKQETNFFFIYIYLIHFPLIHEFQLNKVKILKSLDWNPNNLSINWLTMSRYMIKTEVRKSLDCAITILN